MYSCYPQATAATTVVSTEGRVWNGSSWSTVSPSTSSTYNSSYASEPTVSLVQRYTEYYNSYQALVQQAQTQADQYASSPAYAQQREEWLRHVTWYKYYADQASRAAHYYYQNPNTATPPPFDLPPAPPKAGEQHSSSHLVGGSASVVGQSNSSFSNSSVSQQQSQPLAHAVTPSNAAGPSATAGSTSVNSNASPDGLKRFFHSSLQACTTDEQRKEVQSKLQKMMADALQAGTFHSMNWDSLELVRPTESASPGPSLPQVGGAVHPHKRAWHGSDISGSRPIAATYSPKNNKRSRLEQEAAHTNFSTLGNHDYAIGRTTSLTPPLTETNATTRVTPPLEATATSSANYYGSSSSFSSSPPSQYRYDKQLQTNGSHYGPKKSSPLEQQMGSYYGGGIDDDFVPVPKHAGSKPATHQKGFERSHTKLAKRANRFGNVTTTSFAAAAAASIADASNYDKYMGKGMIGGSNKKLEESDFEMMTVKGTCMTLEKEYLRLTAPPRAELVRPQYILEQHYRNLAAEWNSKSRRRDYLWFCSQFKALRQDCRVQRIQNAFCVRVYETHARIALESDDVNEFNQCQTQLMELYDLLLAPTSSDRYYSNKEEEDAVREHRNEFLAYRFIYYVFLTGSHKGSSSSSDLMTLMLSLTPEQWKDPAIAHAARFREAVALEDYHAFFRLRRNCPNLGVYLVDRMVPSIRLKALQRICKAYRPSVELSFALKELGFDLEAESAEGKEWLESCGCILKDDMVWTKDSVVRESNLQVKQSLI